MHSQPDVDFGVNRKLVVADGRSTDHVWMTNSAQTSFQTRFMEAVDASGAGSRTGFVRLLGVDDNANKVANNWFSRDQRIPLNYRKQLISLGLSIDYVNDGDGHLKVGRPAPQASQSGGLDSEKLQASINFLENQFALWGREFVAAERTMLIAGVYERLTAADTPNLIELSQWLADQVTGEKNERQGEAGSAGGNDRSRDPRRAAKA